MSGFDDIAFATADRSLKLYARSYPGPEPTILMLHGLTRNACDFDGLAARLCGRYRLVVTDQRGRGKSDWDPNPTNYAPATYCADMLHLIDELKLDRPIIIGTSMGGLMVMIMATLRPNGFRGIILNDVGPQIEQAGLDRIAQAGGLTPVCYDDWMTSEDYRAATLKKLGLPQRDLSRGKVQRYGGGSSFQKKATEVAKLNSVARDADMADDPEYQILLWTAVHDLAFMERLIPHFEQDAERLASLAETAKLHMKLPPREATP